MATGDLSTIKLSGSTDGLGIKVTGIDSAASVTVHQAPASPQQDEVYLWAYNDSTGAEVLLTIEFGGTTVPDNVIRVPIPFRAGLIPIIKGQRLTNSLYVKAFADVINVVVLYGHVNRID